MREYRRGRRAHLRPGPVALLLIAVVAACGPAGPERSGDPALDADVRVSPTPAVLWGSRVTIAAQDQGAALVDAQVRVRVEPDDAAEAPAALWREALAAATSAGTYGPVEFDFSGPGAWWVVVELRSSDGRVATLRHPLSVVGPAPSEVGR